MAYEFINGVCTRPVTNTGGATDSRQLVWENHWTATVLTPTDAQHMRLRIVVATDRHFSVPQGGYTSAHDYLRCTGEADIELHTEMFSSPDYGYSVEKLVPNSWAGKTAFFDICGRRDYVVMPTAAQTGSRLSCAGGVIGSGIAVTVIPAGSNLTHIVTAEYGGHTDTIINMTTSTSATWTPDVETYARLMPNASSAAVTLRCRTFSGNTQVGSDSTIQVTVWFAQNAVAPIVTDGWVTVTPDNGTLNIDGWIYGISKALVTIDGSKIAAQFGATVTEYRVYFNNAEVQLTPDQSGDAETETALALTGPMVVVTSVIDSRGQWTSRSETVTPMAYGAPVISEPTAYRCDTGGQAADDGQNVMVQAKASFTSLPDGSAAEQNSVTLTARIRETGSSSWSSAVPLTAGTSTTADGIVTVSFQPKKLGDQTTLYSADRSFELELTATDALGSTKTAALTVETQTWAMKFTEYGDGVAFGKAPSAPNELQLPADWVIRIGQRTLLDMFYPVGSLYWSANSTNPASFMGGTWTAVENVFILAASQAHPAGETGGSETVTLTMDQIPAHSHGSGTSSTSGTIGAMDGSGINSAFQLTYGLISSRTDLDIRVAEEGGGQAHSNMPPYESYYCFKRTA